MTGTEIQIHEGTAVAPFFSSEQKTLIKRVASADGLNDNEFQLFLYTAERLQLDPLAKQIYGIKLKGKLTIQTGIDGYRAVADRTGLYAGNDDAVFDETDVNPISATVTVYKFVAGHRCPFTATARWDEYYPKDTYTGMWDKMPHTMLGKCAEALALRKAFPAQLSGVYTTEEMAQAGPPDAGYATSDGEVQDAITRETAITWGKYSGTAIKDLPAKYLEWAIAPDRKFGGNTEAWQEAMRLELDERNNDEDETLATSDDEQ